MGNDGLKKEIKVGDKWDEIEALLEGPMRIVELFQAVSKMLVILRRLDEGYGGCDQKAEWKLYSRCSELWSSYSCTAHLSLMAVPQTDYIDALDVDADHDCCFVE